jgi:hypothetical protein
VDTYNLYKYGTSFIKIVINTTQFQVAGGCWYVLAIQRVISCYENTCHINDSCDLVKHLSCMDDMSFAANQTIQACLSGNVPFNFGIYIQALPVISSNSIAVKILYPIFWGLMTLRYNMRHTSNMFYSFPKA